METKKKRNTTGRFHTFQYLFIIKIKMFLESYDAIFARVYSWFTRGQW